MKKSSMNKILRKQKRCEKMLLRHEGIRVSPHPTRSILVGNGGLVCEIQSEFLMGVFSQYGSVKNIVMLPNKPYSFVIFDEVADAQKAKNCIHGQRLESGHVFYISFINDDGVPQKFLLKSGLPNGLIILEEFLSEKDEAELLEAVSFKNIEGAGSLKHRQVKHFGYEFLYGNNNINKNICLDEKIPSVCLRHLQKLVALGYICRMPDQLTVNHYKPGQGIPSHVDTHSAFEDGIVSFSLGSQVIMDFSTPGKDSIPVLCPRRSALIMTSESRYAWQHGITPRKTDIVQVITDGVELLTLSHRSTRTSFTFRIVRKAACTCDFKEQCDSQKSTSLEVKDLVDETGAKELENKYVTQVYEEIAEHFSDTRYKPWPKVADFIKSLPKGSVMLDVGCGNGKNIGIRTDCFEIGCDVSLNLAKVCSARKLQVMVADCLALPFRENCADAVICIAVIHHMATKRRRVKALEEIMRVLSPQGKALIYVWALEQDGPDGPSNYLKASRVTKKQQQQSACEMNDDVEIKLDLNRTEIKMPLHRNRTPFEQQDVLVPWTKKIDEEGASVHHRYYHVFTSGELESLLPQGQVKVLSSYYDKGNWCVIFEKCCM